MKHTAFILLSIVTGVTVLQACKQNSSSTLNEGETAPQASVFEVTAIADTATIFGVKQGACLAPRNSKFYVVPTSDKKVELTKLGNTNFKFHQAADLTPSIVSVQDIDGATCGLFSAGEFKLTLGEWNVVELQKKINVPRATAEPTSVPGPEETIPEGSENEETELPTGNSQLPEPSTKQIKILVSGTMATTKLKPTIADTVEYCEIKNKSGVELLVTVKDVSDLIVAIKAKHLPVEFVSDNFDTLVDSSNSICASRRGYIFLEHFKCLKFGTSFDRPGDINAKFLADNQCAL